MLRWCYILLISEFYRFEARSIITESCSTAESLIVIPERCILECVQLLYDNNLCSICDNDTDYSMGFVGYSKALVGKRKFRKWCTGCENGPWQINSDHKELRRRIKNFFNAFEASWCNVALKLNEFMDEKELHRRKRYNPGIGGSHYSPQNPITYSTNYSQTGVMVIMIISGIFLLCALAYLCKIFAKGLDPQSYQINS